jgi:uncharacterized membrane protein
MTNNQETSLPSTAKRNIETITQVEQALLSKRKLAERLGERVARFFGSLLFIAAHISFLTIWIIINIGGFVRIAPFDPYPFSFLSLLIGVEFILLTTFVLLNQKYQIRREEQWSHLHLQLSMLTEQEVTTNVQMLRAISQKLGIHSAAADAEITEMTKPTSVTAFVGEIEKSRDSGLSADETVMGMEKEASKETDEKKNRGA